MTKFLSTLISASIAIPLSGSIATAAPQFSDSEVQSILEYLTAQVEHQEKRIETLETSVRSLGGKTSPAPTLETTNTEAPKTEPGPVKTYVIQEGDMISEIAQANNITRELLLEANNMKNGQQIYIGDTLKIPTAPAPAPTPAKDSPKPQVADRTPVSNGSFATYTVRYGDTLTRIARNQGVSVAAIKSANGLSSDSIAGGQKLKIPAKGSTGGANTSTTQTASAETGREGESYGLYTVQKGDTIYSLARDFYTTQGEIQSLNELENSRIFPGDELIVPTSKYYAKNNLANN